MARPIQDGLRYFPLDVDADYDDKVQLIEGLHGAIGKQHAEVAHYEAVGAGRNRKTIDHSKHHFMCLCREHHGEQHTNGIQTFMNKHHIVPIKLTEETVKLLNL